LAHLSGSVTERVVSDAALPAVGHLFQAVKRRLAPGSYAANQLAGLEEHPERRGRQKAFASALEEMFEQNPGFAEEFQRLVAEVRAAGIKTKLDHVEGPVAIGGDVHQQGHNVAGHDLVIRPEERRGPGG
jgi:hypothetical protein